MLTSGRVAWRGKLQSKAKILKGFIQHAACLNYNGLFSHRIKRGLFFCGNKAQLILLGRLWQDSVHPFEMNHFRLKFSVTFNLNDSTVYNVKCFIDKKPMTKGNPNDEIVINKLYVQINCTSILWFEIKWPIPDCGKQRTGWSRIFVEK